MKEMGIETYLEKLFAEKLKLWRSRQKEDGKTTHMNMWPEDAHDGETPRV